MSSKVVERRDWWKNSYIVLSNVSKKSFKVVFFHRFVVTKRWKKTTLNDFLKHLKEQCTNARKCDSGRPRTSRTAANISDVNDLVLIQEDAPQTHLTSWQIVRKIGIHPLSAVRIIRDDLRLQVWAKKTTRAGAVRNRSKFYQPFAIKLT